MGISTGGAAYLLVTLGDPAAGVVRVALDLAVFPLSCVTFGCGVTLLLGYEADHVPLRASPRQRERDEWLSALRRVAWSLGDRLLGLCFVCLALLVGLLAVANLVNR